MEESESDKICGFELRPDEAVRFYHRGQPEILPADQRWAFTIKFVMTGGIVLYYLFVIFTGGLDSFIALSTGVVAGIIFVILLVRWIVPLIHLRRVDRKRKNWGQIAITNQRLLLRELETGHMREIDREQIASSELDYAKGSRVVSVTVKDAPNARLFSMLQVLEMPIPR